MSLAIIGATSEIGRATARAFALSGHNLLLISRDTGLIDQAEFTGGASAISVAILDADISAKNELEKIAAKIIESFDEDPYVLVAAGTLGAASGRFDALSDLLEVIDVNFRHVAGVVALVSEELQRRRRGCIIILSSVAGDRGRQSNFVYGAAKAGLSVFAQGLRNRLFHSSVHVLTVKLGYVNTPMFRQSLGARSDEVPGFLVGNTEKVGESIFRAAVRRKDVVYIRRVWQLVMFIVRNMPESIFKRLRL
jgi:short-subunit dehydrogenase